MLRQRASPLELFEIGSSAGLNLAFDRYRYDLGVGRWGAADAPVQIASRWEGDAPSLTTPLTIAGRAGCDAKPIDPQSQSDRDRLLSYIWPDQFERLARIEAALALAAQSGFRVERADAAEWLEKRLAVDGATGRTRVVFHSAVWSYLRADTKERLKTTIRSAGASATADAPIAWLSVEPDRHRRLRRHTGDDLARRDDAPSRPLGPSWPLGAMAGGLKSERP